MLLLPSGVICGTRGVLELLDIGPNPATLLDDPKISLTASPSIVDVLNIGSKLGERNRNLGSPGVMVADAVDSSSCS